MELTYDYPVLLMMSGNKDIRERKAEVLNNSYRKDGLIKYAAGDYKGAIKLFSTVRPSLV